MNEPIDITKGAGSPLREWIAFGVLLAAFLVVMLTAAADDGAWFPLLGFAIAFILFGLYGWRARRMTANFESVEHDAARGRLSLVVNIRNGSVAQFFGSGRPGVLTIADGMMRLSGVIEERWPASSITIGRLPSRMASRGLELLTPSGPRFISTVPSTDPAVSWSAWLDRRAAESIKTALAANSTMAASLSPPGWYADPGGSPSWRWWDGQQWGPLSNQ